MQSRYHELSTEGFLWFPNLSLADPTVILPLTVGSLYLANVFVHANNHAEGQQRPKSAKVWTGALSGLAVAMMYFATYVPSAISLYWATSAGTGLAINLLLMSPKIRNAFK